LTNHTTRSVVVFHAGWSWERAQRERERESLALEVRRGENKGGDRAKAEEREVTRSWIGWIGRLGRIDGFKKKLIVLR
jgi:hypothetical protein